MIIEEILISYLSGKMDVPVYAERPERPPKTYIIIEKTGGGMSRRIESATVAIQSYGSTLLEAARLNQNMKNAMDQIIERDDVSSARLNTDYSFTDTSTKQYRYQAVYDVVYFN